MKRGSAINRARAKYPPILYPSYTLTSPFNTRHAYVVPVKTKIKISVFKVAPRQTISTAVLPKSAC